MISARKDNAVIVPIVKAANNGSFHFIKQRLSVYERKSITLDQSI